MKNIQQKIYISGYYDIPKYHQVEAMCDFLKGEGYDISSTYILDEVKGSKEVTKLNIENRAHFILILTEETLEHCKNNADDWTIFEITTAIDSGRNIILIYVEELDELYILNCLPEDLVQQLLQYPKIKIHENNFIECMSELDSILQDTKIVDDSMTVDEKFSTPEYKKAHRYIRKGQKYYSETKYEDAIECYTKAIEIDPEYALPYKERGDTYYQLSDYEKAIQDYTKAIELAPSYIDPYYSCGAIYTQLEDYETAIEFYEEAIERMEDAGNFELAAKIHRDYGILFYKTEKYERAIDLFKRSLMYDPEDRTTHEYLESAEYKLGNNQGTAHNNLDYIEMNYQNNEQNTPSRDLPAPYQAVEESDVTDDPLLSFRLNHPQEPYLSGNQKTSHLPQIVKPIVIVIMIVAAGIAIVESNLVRNQPQNSQTSTEDLLKEGYKDLQAEQYEDAERNFNEVIKQQSDNIPAHLGIAKAQFKQGKPESSIENLTYVIDNSSDQSYIIDAYLSRADAYQQLGEYSKAQNDYEMVINNLQPNKEQEEQAYLGLAQNSYEQENYDDAISKTSNVIRINPDNIDAYIIRGHSYYDKEEYKEAIENYEEALTLGENQDSTRMSFDQNYYGNLGMSYYHTKNYENAIIYLEEAINRSPNSEENLSKYYYYVAHAYHYNKECGKSREKFTTVIELELGLSEQEYTHKAYHGRGLANYCLGNYQDAVEDFTNAIERKFGTGETYIFRGHAYKELGENENASSDYKEAYCNKDLSDQYKQIVADNYRQLNNGQELSCE